MAKVITLRRQIRLEPVVLIELGAQLLSLAVMVAYAVVSASVWALVLGSIVSRVAGTLMSHVAIAGRRNRICWDPAAVREILSFGRWIFVSTLFGYLALRVVVILLARWVPIEVLGIYSISILISEAPQRLMTPIIQSVLMPALAESQRGGPAALARGFARARRMILPGGLLLVLLTIVAAPPFFTYFYDSRYADAAWLAQLGGLPLLELFLAL